MKMNNGAQGGIDAMRGIKTVLFLLALAALSACGARVDEGERLTIRLTAPQNAFIEDFDTNMYKLWLEEQTGFAIEMTWLPANDAERIAMMALASGEDLPDAYIGFGSYDIFNNYHLQRYGASGVIIPLNDMIAQSGIHLQSVWEELEAYNFESLMTMPDGNIYYMPGFSSSLITRYVRQVMWVNQGWLEELNLPLPTTTEAFRHMLAAFNTAGRIPLAGTEEHYGKQVYDFIFNAFIYNDQKHNRLLLENGIVGFAPVRDEWREALVYMHELYRDGLISPFSFTQDNQQHIQMANDPRDILGAFPSPGITFTVMQNSPETMERFVGIGPLRGPNGVSNASVSVPLPKPNGVITSAARHPEAVFKLFDLMLSEEAGLMGRYGERGTDWDFAPPGNISIYGTPATIQIINQIWNKPQNKHLGQIGPYISRPQFSGGVTWSGNATDGEYMNAQAVMLYPAHEPVEYIGALIFTAEEEESILHIKNEIEAYVRQSVIAFITGARDINDDNEWAAYIQGFEASGLDLLLQTAQAAVNRMEQRK
jgi:putative aldouronate transport system substrate-binding protein